MEYRARNLEKELARRAETRGRENELARKRHAENPDIRRADNKRYRQAHPELVKERNKAAYHGDVEGNKARVTAWRIANPDRVRDQQSVWRKANPEKIRAQNQKQYVKADKEKLQKQKRSWQELNRDKVRAAVLKWNRANPGSTALRKAAKLNATPGWANEFFMVEAYRLARLRTKMFGFKWQVDHIVPLVSELVCGLHCEANMQVIPAKSNAAKGNRYWPDMPERASA